MLLILLHGLGCQYLIDLIQIRLLRNIIVHCSYLICHGYGILLHLSLLLGLLNC